MLKNLTEAAQVFLDRIVTTDESWFHYYAPKTKQQSSQWKNMHFPPPKKGIMRIFDDWVK